LYALTQDKYWIEEFSKGFYKLYYINMPTEMSDSFAPLMSWHPGDYEGADALGVSHSIELIPEILCCLWVHLDKELKKYIIWYAFWMADFLFRCFEKGPAFNIPLHGLASALSISKVFPGLKKSKLWKEKTAAFFEKNGKYIVPPCCTKDGYFREGLGYQNVNQLLLTRIFLLFKDEDTGKCFEDLKKLIIAGFNFRADNTLPDGSSFRIGDTMFAPFHEMEMDPRNILHLGAALFNRPELKIKAGSIHNLVPPIETLMMMGLKGYQAWRKMPEPDFNKRKFETSLFLEAGLLNLKSGKGVLGASQALLNASLAHNHTHSDCLGLTLYAGGRKLISDSAIAGYDLASSAMAKDVSAHSVARLSNLLPQGPRFHENTYVQRKQIHQSENRKIQLALAEHNLYEGHCYRRALIQIAPRGKEEKDIFYVVWDRITQDTPSKESLSHFSEKDKVMTNIETNFNLHCLSGDVFREGLSGWSCYKPEGKLKDYATKETLPFSSKDLNTFVDFSDTESNIQVTGFCDEDLGMMGMSTEEGYVASPVGGYLSRPVLAYKWRGYFPFEAVYVLAPFTGCHKKKPIGVEGKCHTKETPGAFELEILLDSENEKWQLETKGLAGKKGEAASLSLMLGGELQETLCFEVL
jgi:hypothetical protein